MKYINKFKTLKDYLDFIMSEFKVGKYLRNQDLQGKTTLSLVNDNLKTINYDKYNQEEAVYTYVADNITIPNLIANYEDNKIKISSFSNKVFSSSKMCAHKIEIGTINSNVLNYFPDNFELIVHQGNNEVRLSSNNTSGIIYGPSNEDILITTNDASHITISNYLEEDETNIEYNNHFIINHKNNSGYLLDIKITNESGLSKIYYILPNAIASKYYEEYISTGEFDGYYYNINIQDEFTTETHIEKTEDGIPYSIKTTANIPGTVKYHIHTDYDLIQNTDGSNLTLNIGGTLYEITPNMDINITSDVDQDNSSEISSSGCMIIDGIYNPGESERFPLSCAVSADRFINITIENDGSQFYVLPTSILESYNNNEFNPYYYSKTDNNPSFEAYLYNMNNDYGIIRINYSGLHTNKSTLDISIDVDHIFNNFNISYAIFDNDYIYDGHSEIIDNHTIKIDNVNPATPRNIIEIIFDHDGLLNEGNISSINAGMNIKYTDSHNNIYNAENLAIQNISEYISYEEYNIDEDEIGQHYVIK